MCAAWNFDASGNKYNKSYIKGFVDISGDLILRHNDISCNGNLRVDGNATFSSIPTISSSITPTNDLQLVTKEYVDSVASSGGGGGGGGGTSTSSDSQIVNKVHVYLKAGRAVYGNPTLIFQALNGISLIGKDGINYLQRSVPVDGKLASEPFKTVYSTENILQYNTMGLAATDTSGELYDSYGTNSWFQDTNNLTEGEEGFIAEYNIPAILYTDISYVSAYQILASQWGMSHQLKVDLYNDLSLVSTSNYINFENAGYATASNSYNTSAHTIYRIIVLNGAVSSTYLSSNSSLKNLSTSTALSLGVASPYEYYTFNARGYTYDPGYCVFEFSSYSASSINKNHTSDVATTLNNGLVVNHNINRKTTIDGNLNLGSSITNATSSSLTVDNRLSTNTITINCTGNVSNASESYMTYHLANGDTSFNTSDTSFNANTSNVYHYLSNLNTSTGEISNSSTNYHIIDSSGLDMAIITNTAIKINSDSQFSTFSDDRLKINEQFIENATETLMKLRPQLYDKKHIFERHTSSERESGLIAQEVYYAAPELRHLVTTSKHSNIQDISFSYSTDPTTDLSYQELGWTTTMASINYIELIPYIIRSNQELHQTIQHNKATIDQLQSIHTGLSSRLTALK